MSFLGRAFSAPVSLRLGFVPRGACCASIVAQLWEPAARHGTGAGGTMPKATGAPELPRGRLLPCSRGTGLERGGCAGICCPALSPLRSDVHKKAGMDGSPVPLASTPEPMEGGTHTYIHRNQQGMGSDRYSRYKAGLVPWMCKEEVTQG